MCQWDFAMLTGGLLCGEAYGYRSMGFCNVNWWIFVRATGLSAPFAHFSAEGYMGTCHSAEVYMGSYQPSLVGLRLFQVGLRARSDIWT